MVNRPLGVTTHTALGTPVSVSSTCTWPAEGIGISTEPRSSRATSAAAGSSKSSMSNGPSGSASPSADSSATSSGATGTAGSLAAVPEVSSLRVRLPNALTSAAPFHRFALHRHRRPHCAAPPHRFALHRPRRSQTCVSAGGTVAAVTAGCFGQPSLVEGGDLDQLDQLDLLHQQLCDAVAAMHHDRRGGVEVDQRDLDLATIARIDGAGTID